MTAVPTKAMLIDAPGDPGRTTATLLASLAARLGTLYLVSGSDAVGALTAGFAALGRHVARTADGARLRRAIEAGRAGANGDALWSTLRIGEWASSFPPSPVLDQLRNDLALLLTEDLERTLELMPIPGDSAGPAAAPAEEVTFADFALGFWAFSLEAVRSVEALAAPTLMPAGTYLDGEAPIDEPKGELLR